VNRPLKSEAGFAIIEALITLFIVVFGLLALVGLQNRMLLVEMESYQRSQAITLAKDMKQRIEANPLGTPCYAGTAVGAGVSAPPTCNAGSLVVSRPGTTAEITAVKTAVKAQVDADLARWHNALLGVAEKKGSVNVGAMIGARGCIADIDAAGTSEVLVTVAWQGLTETVATPVSCGSGQYTLPGAGSASDAVRRTLALAVRAAKLD
jgi:type IV pilus assembly protein PilV